MPYNSSIITNPATLEARKFVEITNDARFPTLSVVRTSYDQSYPPNTSTLGFAVTSLDTYSNYAVAMYLTNASDINQNITLSATTLNVNNVGIAGVAAVSGTVTVVGNTGQANATSWSVTQVQCTTASYAAFPSAVASIITISNTTNDTLLLSKAGAGIGLPLLPNSSIDITVVSNANEIQLKATTSPIPVSAYGVITKY